GHQPVEHVAQLLTGDAGNRLMTPVRYNVLLQEPLGFRKRSRSVTTLAMLDQKLRHDLLNSIGPLLLSLPGRIAALSRRPQDFGAQRTGRFQIDGGIGAERVFAWPTVVPVAHCP